MPLPLPPPRPTLLTPNAMLLLADERSGRFLGKALRGNASLTELNLRLNALGDAGGAQLLEALSAPGAPPCVLTSLNLASNHLGAASAAAFAALLHEQERGSSSLAGGVSSYGNVSDVANSGCSLLSSVDLSGNALAEEDASIIAAAVHANSRVTSVDLRGNPGISATSESLQSVIAATRRNEVVARGGPAAPLTGVFAAAFGALSSPPT
jgi:hypothetical protein